MPLMYACTSQFSPGEFQQRCAERRGVCEHLQTRLKRATTAVSRDYIRHQMRCLGPNLDRCHTTMPVVLPNPSVMLGGLSHLECKNGEQPMGETHTILVCGRPVSYTDQVFEGASRCIHAHSNLDAVNNLLNDVPGSMTLNEAKVYFAKTIDNMPQ